MLSGKGFETVYNLKGGIRAWNGVTVDDSADEGLELFDHDATYKDAVVMAYALEKGLKEFYAGLAEKSDDELRPIYEKLTGFEEKHMARLARTYREKQQNDITGEQLPKLFRERVEGGLGTVDLQAKLQENKELSIVFEAAMSIEAFAMDMYARLARLCGIEDTGDLFIRLAEEEKNHLAYLGREAERHL